MNDTPLRVQDPHPYKIFIETGFQDSANPQQSNYNESATSEVFYHTYGNPSNTWSGNGSNELSQTLDYIMMKSAKHEDHK